VQPGFLQRYLQAFHHIEGWFEFDAALLFMALNQQIRAEGLDGDVLEIGVYHGLSTIALATLRSEGKKLVVVDPFENSQESNIAMYGKGIRAHFERNFASFYPDAPFLNVIARPSSEVTPQDLSADGGKRFSFCHIDGGHSREETCGDLRLCNSVLMEGGLLAIDDYFNPQHPGVCEGAVEFYLENRDTLQPLVIAYNKVLFQKRRDSGARIEKFLAAFPGIGHEIVTMWDSPAILLSGRVREYVDLYESSPQRFVRPGANGPRVTLTTGTSKLKAPHGKKVVLDVDVENVSPEATPSGKGVFGMSYHLLSDSAGVLKHDNDRTWILKPLDPGERRRIPVTVTAPEDRGQYIVEVDLVWENVMWFKDIGNPTATVKLLVE
jgi:hypothetical protein